MKGKNPISRTSFPIRRAFAFLVLSLLLGCSGEGSPDRFTAWDSAGILIVESNAPAWGEEEGWTLGDSVLLDLTETGEGPNHEFYRVSDGTVLPDGRILLGNAGSSEVRIYSPEGEFLVSTGREGEGPGEYRQITDVLLFPGDSIGVFSWPTRLTVLAPDLSLGRVARLGDRGRYPELLGPTSLITREVFASVMEYEGMRGLIRAPLYVVRRNLEGRILDTIWEGPGYEEFMFPMGEGISSALPLFARGTSVAARDLTVLVGTSESMEYQVLNSLGGLVSIVRVPSYDLSLDAAEIAAEREARIRPDYPAEFKEMVRRLPDPESRPAYGDFMVDSEGYLWAEEVVTLTKMLAPRRWEIFAPSGGWMGAMETPARFRPFEIGEDYVLGVFEDDLDVQHPRLLSLARADPAGAR